MLKASSSAPAQQLFRHSCPQLFARSCPHPFPRSCPHTAPARRHASSTANPYPFPSSANPSPHQIFHLPLSATRDEVKARYYDLVRIYHPDSPVSRTVPPATAHARFQAISAAYAALSGKAARAAAVAEGGAADGGLRADYHSLSTAMWRARQRRRAELDVGLDERWKDALMLGAVVLSLGAFVWQTYSARRQAMAEAEAGGRPLYHPSPSRPSARKPAPRPASSDETSLAEPSADDVTAEKQ